MAPGSGAGGAGGAGGQGGSMGVQEVEMFKCDGLSAAAMITASSTDYKYHPDEVTLNVGEVLYFEPDYIIINMTSGTPPDGDGKFYTPQGLGRCLKFNVAGVYPFFSVGTLDEMKGTVYVNPL